MSLRGRIFCILLAFLYLGTLDTSYVNAAKTSKRSGKKSKKKSKSKSKSGKKKVRTSNPVSVAATTTTGETTTDSSVQQTTDGNVATEASAQVAENASANTTTEVAQAEPIDVPNDEKWDDFRICMQQSCGGGDDQPANVQCYKTVNFDNAFLNCKLLVDEGKRKQFEEYFRGPFIQKEQSEACVEIYKGTWKDNKCVVKVSYRRPRVKNECTDTCGAVSISKEWVVDGRNYACSGDDFGAETCFKDSPNCQASKIEEVTSYIQMGSAALSMGLGAVAGVQNAKISITSKETISEAALAKKDAEKAGVDTTSWTTTKDVTKDFSSRSSLIGQLDTDGKEITADNLKDSARYKELKKEQWSAGIVGGLQAGSGQLAAAAGSFVSAKIHGKEKGDRVYGTCNLPNGEVVSEGGSYKLSW